MIQGGVILWYYCFYENGIPVKELKGRYWFSKGEWETWKSWFRANNKERWSCQKEKGGRMLPPHATAVTERKNEDTGTFEVERPGIE